MRRAPRANGRAACRRFQGPAALAATHQTEKPQEKSRGFFIGGSSSSHSEKTNTHSPASPLPSSPLPSPPAPREIHFAAHRPSLPDKPYPQSPGGPQHQGYPSRQNATGHLFLTTREEGPEPKRPTPTGLFDCMATPRSVGRCAPNRPPGPGAGVPNRASLQTGEGGSEGTRLREWSMCGVHSRSGAKGPGFKFSPRNQTYIKDSSDPRAARYLSTPAPGPGGLFGPPCSDPALNHNARVMPAETERIADPEPR